MTSARPVMFPMLHTMSAAPGCALLIIKLADFYEATLELFSHLHACLHVLQHCRWPVMSPMLHTMSAAPGCAPLIIKLADFYEATHATHTQHSFKTSLILRARPSPARPVMSPMLHTMSAASGCAPLIIKLADFYEATLELFSHLHACLHVLQHCRWPVMSPMLHTMSAASGCAPLIIKLADFYEAWAHADACICTYLCPPLCCTPTAPSPMQACH